MSETPDIPVEEENSVITFDLYNLKLELDGMLDILRKDPEALSQLYSLLLDASEKCSQAMAELKLPINQEPQMFVEPPSLTELPAPESTSEASP